MTDRVHELTVSYVPTVRNFEVKCEKNFTSFTEFVLSRGDRV